MKLEVSKMTELESALSLLLDGGLETLPQYAQDAILNASKDSLRRFMVELRSDLDTRLAKQKSLDTWDNTPKGAAGFGKDEIV